MGTNDKYYGLSKRLATMLAITCVTLQRKQLYVNTLIIHLFIYLFIGSPTEATQLHPKQHKQTQY